MTTDQQNKVKLIEIENKELLYGCIEASVNGKILLIDVV